MDLKGNYNVTAKKFELAKHQLKTNEDFIPFLEKSM